MTAPFLPRLHNPLPLAVLVCTSATSFLRSASPFGLAASLFVLVNRLGSTGRMRWLRPQNTLGGPVNVSFNILATGFTPYLLSILPFTASKPPAQPLHSVGVTQSLLQRAWTLQQHQSSSRSISVCPPPSLPLSPPPHLLLPQLDCCLNYGVIPAAP